MVNAVSKYQKYAEYKDSGIKEIGTIPIHWHTSRVKYLTKCLDGQRIPLNAVERGERKGDIPYWGANKIVDYVNDWLFDEELILLGEDGAPFFDKLKDVAFAINGKIWPNNHVHVLRPFKKVVTTKFLTYSLNCIDYSLYISGSTRDKLNQSDMDNILIRLPTLIEQTQIANFLDHETAKIDSLIEKQQQLIQLLKEKRQAVISHAVTKGLDPNAPMKDSGVEWLGEVPEHWGLVPLKYLCSFSGGGTPSKDNLSYWTDGDIPWVSPKDMKTFWIKETQDYITEKAIKESSTNMVEPNSLLMVVRSGILQRTIPIAINKVPVTMNQDMKALKFGNRVLVEYIADLIHGNTSELLLEWSKEGATVESIEHEYLANSIVPVPPIEEQQSITTLVAKKMGVYRELTCKAESQILLLQERRTALISAAVTGKIDVRNWQNPTEAKMEFSA